MGNKEKGQGGEGRQLKQSAPFKSLSRDQTLKISAPVPRKRAVDGAVTDASDDDAVFYQ